VKPEARSPAAALFWLGRSRDCLLLLTARAVKVRYRRSVLGFAWSLLYPLLSMLVLTLVFSQVFSGIQDYPLYVVVGVLAWGFVSLSCVQGMDGLLTAAPILRLVYVPPALFPLAAVGANLVHLMLSVAVLPVVMAATGCWPGFHPLLLLAGLLCLTAFSAGLTLLLSACNLFLRDIRYFFDALLLLWFYATPIVYPADVIPRELGIFLWANPMFWLLEVLRSGLYSGQDPTATTMAAAVMVASAVLVLGWSVFAGLQRRFYLYL